jgi:hypothetical protein
MSMDQNSGVSNVQTYLVKYKPFKRMSCDLKGYNFTNNDDLIRISYTEWEFIAYLQEMSTLFREMSANQVCRVHEFSHV